MRYSIDPQAKEMCTEFVLAILYFFTIFLVTFFLFQLLQNYLRNILFVSKIKKCFQNAKEQNRFLFSFLLQTETKFRSKNGERKKKFLSLSLPTSSFFPTNDIVLLGQFSRFLQPIHFFDQEKKKPAKKRTSSFSELLEQQYLSSSSFSTEKTGNG